MDEQEVTKPCPECGKLMVEEMYPVVTASLPPLYGYGWRCYGCGHAEHSRTERGYMPETGYERWKRANPDTEQDD